MIPTTESWGQPPISQYSICVDGDNMYATTLYDPYSESDYSDVAYPFSEDIEDITIYMETRDEPVVPWEQVKEELARDGLL